MMKRWQALLLGLLLLGACTGSGENPSAESASGLSGKLVLTGSSTVAPLAAEIAARFEERHPQVRIDVQTGGSSRGVADARTGLADIGMASRTLKDSEKDLQAHTIAMDGVCLIVHASNPVEQLSDEQVRQIYTGQLTDWSEVGGTAGQITVVNKAEGRSTLELFLHHFGLENPQIQAQVVIGDNEQGIKTVAGNPGAIGYVSIGTAEYDAQHGVAIKLLPIGGIAPTIASVKNGSFPISRPLNLLTGPEPSPLARAFLAFAQSSEVRDLVEAQYFVSLQP